VDLRPPRDQDLDRVIIEPGHGPVGYESCREAKNGTAAGFHEQQVPEMAESNLTRLGCSHRDGKQHREQNDDS
jgi:hypothetical protein